MLSSLRIVLLLVIFLDLINAENLGHRLGGDVYSHENTLVCYRKALKNLQHKKNFKNVEFDIRETKDNKIVVFHDRNIERIIPKNNHNIKILTKILKKKKFKKIRVKDLTLKEMTQLVIAKNIYVPTLEDVLKESIKWDVKKPIHIEVKSLHSDKARYKLIDLVNKYNQKLDISLISFRNNFYNSFPFTPRWISIFKNNNIEAYQIDKYSFTEKSSYCFLSGSFTSLLPESTFLISKKVGRTQEFQFVLPTEIESKGMLKIGIYGGADDSGDGGVSFHIHNKNGKKILTGFSNAKGWEWFSLEPKDVREFILTIEDSDTSFIGKYPGNGGQVKVLYFR